MIYHILQYNDFNVSTNGFTNVDNDFIPMISHVLQYNDFHVRINDFSHCTNGFIATNDSTDIVSTIL